jgi:ABC-type glycerol-3-phosphate transport system substrate-binding protein
LCGLLLVLAAGCPRPDSGKNAAESQPMFPNVKLRLLVVGDPAMASAIEAVQGEWNAQTGSTLQVQTTESLDLAAKEPPDVDAIILATYELGVLAEKGWIVPIPKTLIEDRRKYDATRTENRVEQEGWGGIFSLLRAHEAVWGSETMAVPLGSPVLICYYRADLLERLGTPPPRTWAEYRKLAELLGDRAKLGNAAPPAGTPWYGALEPLGPGWAGLDLIARAASYATHRSNYSALFKIDTMEPLINGPPFVRALKELVAVAGSGPPEQFRYDPAAVRRAFWQGHCGLALTWPTAADKITVPEGQDVQVGFVELPGSNRAYNVSAKTWDPRSSEESASVPLLSIAGRAGVVTTRSPPDSQPVASRLLLWLSAATRNRQVSSASPATTLFRQSDVSSPQVWVERPISISAAAQYGGVIRETLSRQQWLFALRIPGRGEYLAVLDEAVQASIRGSKDPQAALDGVAGRWKDITLRIGLEAQRTAYQHSLGL